MRAPSARLHGEHRARTPAARLPGMMWSQSQRAVGVVCCTSASVRPHVGHRWAGLAYAAGMTMARSCLYRGSAWCALFAIASPWTSASRTGAGWCRQCDCGRIAPGMRAARHLEGCGPRHETCHLHQVTADVTACQALHGGTSHAACSMALACRDFLMRQASHRPSLRIDSDPSGLVV